MTLKELNHKAATLKDSVGYIIEYESGELSLESTLVLFAYLIKTGMAWQLQSSIYGRPAAQLIEKEIISKTGQILRIPSVENPVLNYTQIKEAIKNHSTFKGNSAHAEYILDSYKIFSYDTPIYSENTYSGQIYFDNKYYSPTTTKLQNIIKEILLKIPKNQKVARRTFSYKD